MKVGQNNHLIVLLTGCNHVNYWICYLIDILPTYLELMSLNNKLSITYFVKLSYLPRGKMKQEVTLYKQQGQELIHIYDFNGGRFEIIFLLFNMYINL